jgi:hypothetical protein
VPNVVSLPISWAITSGVDTNKPGFRVQTWQGSGEPNTIAWMEDQLIGLHGVNQADLSQADALGWFTEPLVIDYDISSGSTANGFQPSVPFPGLPGSNGNGTDNSSIEALTYVYFPTAGSYTMGVNSDDGFQVSVGPRPRDRDFIVLGSFNGGRGNSNPGGTDFSFTIAKAGFYPFRLIWENGTGGCNVQWYSRPADGSRVLINDPANPQALLAYRSGPEGDPAAIPWLSSTTVVPNQVNVAVNAAITVALMDGASPVKSTGIQMLLNGTAVTPTVTQASYAPLTNNTTTISYTPSTPLALNTIYTLTLVYSDASKTYTNSWNFTTSPLGQGTLFVEAEDFNFNHGQWLTNANLGTAGPYNVGAYQGLGNGNNGFFGNGSDYGIDFNTDHSGNPSAVYRPGTAIGTEVTGNTPSRGLFSVTNNWDVGWNDTGDWYNYTRTFPAGKYLVYASISSGGGDMHAELDQVTGTANTINQTATKLGNFDAPTTGNWQVYSLVPLRDATNNPVQLSLNGTTTLRFAVLPGNLNFDYLAFLPVGGVTPTGAKLTGSFGASGLSISWTPSGGTLQSSPALGASANWTDVGSQNPTLVPTAQLTAPKFYRVKQ